MKVPTENEAKKVVSREERFPITSSEHLDLVIFISSLFPKMGFGGGWGELFPL